MKKISIQTQQREQLINITSKIQQYLTQIHADSGVCYVHIPHTTAAVTINENADPDVGKDILQHLDKLVPYQDHFRHFEGNSDAHIKASLLGVSQMVLVQKGELQLGTWQGLFLAEFDGPRQRQVWVSFQEEIHP